MTFSKNWLRKPQFGSVLALSLCVLTNANLSFAESTPAASAETYPADLLQISNTEAFSKYVFLVDKSARKLLVFEHEGERIKKIDEVPADIGKNGGNKTTRDDHKTPEGIYFFETKKTAPEIPYDLYGKMALTMNYPNLFDALEKKTGSGIWLHSIPETVPLTRGSRGCVVIRNDALEKIESYVKLKQTPIIIYDEVKYVSKDEHDRRRKEMSDYISSWKQAWESMNVEKYMSFYDEEFTAPGFDYKGWQRHKNKLKNRYKYIKVTLSQPFLLLHKNQLIIKTLQKYESDGHTDYGVKVIHALMKDGKYKIVHEEWTPSKEDGTIQPVIFPSELTAAQPETKSHQN